MTLRRCSVLTARVSLLTALGLACLAFTPRLASAQELDLSAGSALVVNDGVQSGTYLNSTNYTFSGGADTTTYQYQTLHIGDFQSPSQLTLGTGASSANVYVGFGSTADITGGTITNSLGNPNGTANVSGGSINFWTAQDTSIMSGGSVTNVGNSGVFTMTGGAVTNFLTNHIADVSGGTVTNFKGGSTVNISGGHVLTFTNRFDGTVSVSGGTIDTLTGDTLGSINPQYINVSGGDIGSLSNVDLSIALISGGTVGTMDNANGGDLTASGGSVGAFTNEGAADIVGGTFASFDNFTGGRMDVYGSGLSLSNGFIVGTLQDSEAIDTPYQDDGGILVLHNIAPEPSEYAGLSLGVLGLAGMVLRARKRRTA